ncbi:bifunctional methylenetetrahydrofolate dehydrogenase/methenyltetrahydrofolate cyclohydrolase FolD [Staphylospora marina]|uniref:bifunctional methylenetetrahydrofolate dehydrogenase/methenyltetrahydrofolate cyclohydrolase FolD n=1 Tax=Staphylospora marina TaxID=2490858 RepID=UPI000F5B92E6|nr:bifunctional methylenetetrahydrofolate dehydrogenase/methenyltetrahydrofolate cyclohydrolase FolD [Staphylospora marina]
MSFQLIDGKEIAKQVRNELKAEVNRLREHGLVPGLAVILVGNHPASESYVRGKIRASEEVGIHSELIRLSETAREEELLAEVQRLNRDPNIHGILVQLPLPAHMDPARVIAVIDPAKDVDGFTPLNTGNMMIGQDALKPCTPVGIIELLKRADISVAGKHVVVVGRSNIVGKPVSILLQQENATVTMCHSRTKDLAYHTRQADILVAAVGRAEMITADHVKEGVVVIDVGVNRREDGKLVGDVRFDEVAPLASAITPVPGGVGPMTIAMLLANTVTAAKRIHGLD